jgi:hypothetical protein
MQDRANIQNIFRPQTGEGQRIAIGLASVRSTALDLHREHHIFATKVCWIRIGDAAVAAVQLTDFPLSAGAVYTHIPKSADEQYIAVIEDASVTAVTGFLFIGQSEG